MSPLRPAGAAAQEPRAAIAVFASGSGSNFEAIAAACADGRLAARVALLVCDKPGAPVCGRAERLGIETFVFDPHAYPSKAAFEGEIVNYTSTTASVSSDDYALLNRLTITVKVRFTNALDEKMSFNRTFQAYEDYDSTKLLTEVEGELIPQIVDKIVTDIFQAAASNW
mgnify:CR=1 FL=1